MGDRQQLRFVAELCHDCPVEFQASLFDEVVPHAFLFPDFDGSSPTVH